MAWWHRFRTDGMREGQVLCLSPRGFHRVAYVEWGDAKSARVAVCVHGLTRQGRDFDYLARALASDGYRVVCPDVVGRGRSDRLPEAGLYGFPQYLADMTALVARIGADSIDWIGTSMGGLIGMMLAAQAGTPIRRLVLNDVGAFIPWAALMRIGAYVGADPRFADLAAAEVYIRGVHRPFGPLSDSEWGHLTEHSVRPDGEGKLKLCYDPAIGNAFRGTGSFVDIDLRPHWALVRAPTLVLRGAESDILPKAIADDMIARSEKGQGPNATVVEFAGIGHAPALMADDQIGAIREWLRTP